MTSIQRVGAALSATTILLIGVNAGAQVVIGTPYPPYPAEAPDSSVRIEVTPRDAAVYVDGYYAGVVDEFDGVWQRLRVEPGQHEIAIYRDGYQTLHEHVYLTPDKTFNIKRQMEALPPGAPAEPRPVPMPRPVGVEEPRPAPRGGARPERPERPNREPPRDAPQPARGRLELRLQPSDADVLIDGQPWPAGPDQERVGLELAPGRHLIQVRKAGFIGYATEIDVRPGEIANVDVTLRTQP